MKQIFLAIFFHLSFFLQAQTTFPHFKAFQDKLTQLANNPSGMDAFFSELSTAKKTPFAMGDSVAFLYRGTASSVGFAGDFNGWSPTAATKVGATNVWQWVQKFPSNARLDYKIVVGSNWILDPSNPNQQMSGFGPNSELRMPTWVFPQETVRANGILQGSLSANQLITSTKLGYAVQYKVYTPPNYANLSALPVVYVTDGHEYASDALGAMLPVTDNLINGFNGKKIRPLILVFIDPRNPSNTNTNRRQQEYTTNPNYADFVAEELVPAIDTTYKTDKNATARMILGTSLGGLVSTYIGYRHSATFGNIAPMSPAYWFSTSIFTLYENSPKLPLKFFMTTGTIRDTQADALQMKGILESKTYPIQYIEVPEGHSWGNWRALLDEILVAAFPVSSENEVPNSPKTLNAYPNPFSDSLKVNFELTKSEKISLALYDVLGRKILVVLEGNEYPAGKFEIPVSISTLSSGNYLLQFRSETQNQSTTIIKQ